MTRKLGCWLLVLMMTAPAFAARVGVISGYVRDSAGIPQMGATVEIFSSPTSIPTTVFTDSQGHYSAESLPAGKYQVRVSLASFLPSLRENVKVNSGAHVLINMTLSTLVDALKLLPPRRTASSEPDDWHWTLRSGANRPVLRVVEEDKKDKGLVVVARTDKPEQGDDRDLKARVAFLAGAEAQGFGGAGDMTTAFALQKSMFSSGTLSLKGDIGGSTSGDPTGVLRATYAHDFGETSRPSFTVTYRHFANPGAAVENSPYSAIEMNSSDSMTVAGLVDLQYGADVQSLEFARRVTAVRPYGSVQVHLSPNLVVEYRYATSEPDTRAAKGFDSAPADLSESGPRMALLNGGAEVERARHQDISVSKRMGKTSLQVAAYTDSVGNLVLTGAGDPSSYSDDVLPDIYSGTFSYAYNGTLNTTGARLVMERQISDDLTATVDYSTGDAVTADAGTWQTLAERLATGRLHAIAGKVSGYVPVSGTRWIASYKWTSGNAVSVVDAFNASPGQADPYLSIFIRQPLPCTSFIPGKMDALLDIRNLLAQGYIPATGPDGRPVYLVQAARSLRGGLAFSF